MLPSSPIQNAGLSQATEFVSWNGSDITLEVMLEMFKKRALTCHHTDISKTNFSNSIFAAGIFDTNGGKLTINKSGVNLYIPVGAIPKGTQKEIYMYLDQNKNVKPNKERRTRVAPIIHCGPPGTTFDEPFVLSFPHCAADEEQWNFSGLIQDTWKEPWRSIDEEHDGITFTQGGQCFIIMNHFTNFTLTGVPLQPDGAKCIRMCTFGKHFDSSPSYSFNVRAWNPYDQEAVIKEHRELQETRMDVIKPFKIQNTGKDVDVYITDIHDKWESDYELEKKMHPEQFWYELTDGSTPPSCRFRLKTKEHDLQPTSVHCRVKSEQEGAGNEIELEVNPILKEQNTNHVSDMKMENTQTKDPFLVASKREFGTLDDFELPPKICYELCIQLDEERPTMCDWRGLAVQLKLDKMIPKYAKQSSKTPTLLHIIKETTKGPETFIKKLYDCLLAAEIHHSARLIKPFLKVDIEGSTAEK